MLRLAVATVVAPVMLASCGAFDGPRTSSLPVETIRIDTASGSKAFTVEVAADAASQQRGLMYRRDLPPDAGMLFDFHQNVLATFWMKDTPLPLDMVFIKSDGTVASIAQNAVPYSTHTIPSPEPVRAVLEINGGRAHDLGIRPGDKVRAPIFDDVE